MKSIIRRLLPFLLILSLHAPLHAVTVVHSFDGQTTPATPSASTSLDINTLTETTASSNIDTRCLALNNAGINNKWQLSNAWLWIRSKGDSVYAASSHSHAATDLTSGTLNNARINWAAPNAIGGTTPAAGTFTTLTATTFASAQSATEAGQWAGEELSGNGTSYMGWEVPDAITTTRVYKLSDTAPTEGDVMVFGAPATGYSNQTWTKLGVPAEKYASINAAVTAIGSTVTTLRVSTAQTLAANLTIPATLTLEIVPGGSIVKASTYTVTFAAGSNFKCPDNYQAFSGFSSGDITGLTTARPEWFGTGYTALSCALSSLSSGGKMLIDSAYISNDELTSSTDHITVEFGPKGSITMSAADKDGLNLSGDYVTILNPVMTGEGTFVDSGSSGACLINLSGNYATVKHAILTDPEQTGLKCTGDYPNLEDITIIGGPYYADAAAIGSDVKHYGVWLVGVDSPHIRGIRILPNGDGGVCTEGFNSSTGDGLITNGDISDIFAKNCWDHGVYAVVEGCTISGVKTDGCGVKLGMRATGTATKGNALSNFNINVGNYTGPLLGDTGLNLENWCWSTVKGVVILSAADSALYIHGNAATDSIIENVFSDFVIDTVQDGSGANSYGIIVSTTNLFANNAFSNFIIKSIGTDTDGDQIPLYIFPTNNDAHVGNKFTNFIINGSQEYGISPRYLTNCKFQNFQINNVGLGESSIGAYVVDCNYCDFDDFFVDGGTGTMGYAYRENTSNNNTITRFRAANVATSTFYGLGAATKVLNENSGAAASTADGGTITHGFDAAPGTVQVTASVAGEIATVTSVGATTFTVAIKKTDGSAGTSQTIYWRAIYKP